MAVTNERKMLSAVAIQLINGDEIVLDDRQSSEARQGRSLALLQFKISGREFEAIEQNRKKPSRWGQLARDGHQVVQVRHVVTKRYVAVVDGKVREYGR
jgi:hypothetical protein